MALKAGRVGVRADQVDSEGKVIYDVPEPFVVEDSETIVWDEDQETGENTANLATELVTKIDNSLQLPVAPPLSTGLVGVGTNGAQKMIGVGEGLSIVNDVLSATGGSGGEIDIFNTTQSSQYVHAYFDTSKYCLLLIRIKKNDKIIGYIKIDASVLGENLESSLFIVREMTSDKFDIGFIRYNLYGDNIVFGLGNVFKLGMKSDGTLETSFTSQSGGYSNLFFDKVYCFKK